MKEKKKWQRSAPMKGFLLLLILIAFATAASCGLLLVYLYRQDYNPFENSAGYTASSQFTQQIQNNSLDIIQGILDTTDIQEHYDDEIDLKELSDNQEITFSNTSGLSYLIKNLRDWSPDDLTEDNTLRVSCTKPDGRKEYMTLSDFYEKVSEEKLTFQPTASYDTDDSYFSGMTQAEIQNVIFSWLQENDLSDGSLELGIKAIVDSHEKTVYTEVKNYNGYVLKEVFPPVGADSIWDVINTSETWNQNPENAFDELSHAVYRFSSAAAHSRRTDFNPDRSNLTYLFADKDHQTLYSNNEKYSSYPSLENYLQNFSKSGCYIIMESRNGSDIIDTNLSENSFPPYYTDTNGIYSGSTAMYLTINDSVKESLSLGKNYVFAVQVDTQFPISDSFASAAQNYNKYSELVRQSLYLLIPAVLILLAAYIWLTVTAGRNSTDEELHLNFFDRWFTEISAGLVFFSWLFLMEITIEEMTSFIRSDLPRSLISTGVLLGFITAVFFTVGYLSLVRRIKAKTLWRGSLLHVILNLLLRFFRHAKQNIKRFFRFYSVHTGSRIKATAALAAFCFFQFIFSGIAVNGSTFFLFPAFLMDLAVLVYFIRKAAGREQILNGLKKISGGELTFKIPTEQLSGEQKTEADYINNIGGGLDAAVEKSLKNERTKTELITNVSHDIKTPLTSIINYVDLLKRENFTDPKILGYLKVLDEKSHRLKVLTDDIVEASKASTGNISLEMTDLNFVEMIQQVIGEFEERFEARNLSMIVQFGDEPSVIYADGQRMWRVLENIFTNVAKYAMEGTRVYAEVSNVENKVLFTLKNISAEPLNITPEELTERFIRGDVSRNTEGSGLGLSIAKSLTELQGGEFDVMVDGDLFKVGISFLRKR